DPPVLHDRFDSRRRGVSHSRDGLHRLATASRRVDRRPGPVAARADRRADGLLHHPWLLPGWHFDGRADHGRDSAHRREGRHRPAVVRHLHRARGRDGANHASGRVQPFRAAGDDQEADHVDRSSRDADALFDDRSHAPHLLLSAARDRPAAAHACALMMSVSTYSARLRTPFAVLGVRTGAGAVTGIEYLSLRESAQPPVDSIAERACRQLERYLADPHWRFTLPLAPAGTAFQRRVWDALEKIPLGESRTYGELARSLHTAPRAVGGACGANPIALVI